ncbi:VOC family protein [Phenylobacterium sp.]|uniref:VOC family protein n=1 Tax=Phenylobacterium sp. TaxID=1871053 RepID=UPI002C48C031|nr:VOC family protein [Phenylobacterium sp.]HVI30707.1 VOC family protein [Phenylobacterium sp.]
MADAPRPAFIPAVFYREPLAAIRWLEQAFGFETTTLVTDAEGNVGYSELAFEGGFVSVGGEWEGPQIAPARMRSPASLDGIGTQLVRVHLAQGLDEHCARARAAGARILEPPADQFYGHRTYRVLDPEGHVWVFSQPVREVPVAEQEAATGLKIRTSLEEA